MAVIDSSSFTIVNAEIRRKRGPLVKVKIGPGEGQYVKMYQLDAEEQGLIPKSSPPVEDKSRPPTGDKLKGKGEDKTAQKGVRTPTPEADDFTTIDGVGRATAKMLGARGIETFEQLKTANLALLGVNAQARLAIEKWRAE